MEFSAKAFLNSPHLEGCIKLVQNMKAYVAFKQQLKTILIFWHQLVLYILSGENFIQKKLAKLEG